MSKSSRRRQKQKSHRKSVANSSGENNVASRLGQTDPSNINRTSKNPRSSEDNLSLRGFLNGARLEYWSIVMELLLGTTFVCMLFLRSPYFQVVFWLLVSAKVLQVIARCQCLWVPTHDSGATFMRLSLGLEGSLLVLIGLSTLVSSPQVDFLINIIGPLLSMGSPIFFAIFFKHSAVTRSSREVASQAETSILLMSTAGGGLVLFSLMGNAMSQGLGLLALLMLFLLLAAFLSYARLLEKIIQGLKLANS